MLVRYIWMFLLVVYPFGSYAQPSQIPLTLGSITLGSQMPRGLADVSNGAERLNVVEVNNAVANEMWRAISQFPSDASGGVQVHTFDGIVVGAEFLLRDTPYKKLVSIMSATYGKPKRRNVQGAEGMCHSWIVWKWEGNATSLAAIASNEWPDIKVSILSKKAYAAANRANLYERQGGECPLVPEFLHPTYER